MLARILPYFLLFAALNVSAASMQETGILPPRPHYTDEQVVEGATSGLINLYIAKYKAEVHQPTDLVRAFFAKANPHDRNAIKNFLAGLSGVPTLERKDHTLLFQFVKEVPLAVEWPRFTKPDMVIDGIKFQFDVKNSLAGNYENFIRRVRMAQKAENASLNSIFLPRAHAGIYGKLCIKTPESCKMIIATLFGATAGPIVADTWSGLKSGMCFSMNAVGMQPWQSLGTCIDWKTNRDAWAAKTLNASLANTMPAGQTIGLQINSESSCPTINANGDQTFETWVREVVFVKGDPVGKPVGEWYYFRGEAKNAQLTTGSMYKTAEDSKDDELKTKAVYVLELQGGPNKALQLQAVKAKNYDYGAVTPYKTINLSMAALPGFNDTFALMQAISEAAQGWFETCVKLQANAKLNPFQTKKTVQSMMNPSPPTVQPTSGDSDAKK